MPQFNQMQM